MYYSAETVQTLGVVPEDFALVAVKTVQSVLCPKPDEPVVVLHNIGDPRLGKSRTRRKSAESYAPPLDHRECHCPRWMRFTGRHRSHERPTAHQNGSTSVSEDAQIALSQSRQLNLEFQKLRHARSLECQCINVFQLREWNTTFPLLTILEVEEGIPG